MQGKLVLITGASTRIGAGIARYFASNGWDVALHSSKPSHMLLPLCHAIETEYSVRSYCLTANFLHYAAASHLWQQLAVLRGTHTIECLVNNAALFLPDTLPTIECTDPIGQSLPSHRAHLRVNCHVPIQLIHLFCSQFNHAFSLSASAYDCNALVINILDADMHTDSIPGFTHYLRSKRALHRSTMALSRRYGPQGVRINAIAPGILLKGVRQSSEHFYRLQKQRLLPVPPSQIHLEQTIAFLLENTSMTGQTLYVDAGRHLLR